MTVRVIANEMIKAGADKKKMFSEMEDMVNLEYHLPPKIDELTWMRKVIVSTPNLAYKAAKRVLSGLEVRPSIVPTGDAIEDRDRANEQEYVLSWQLKQIAKRVPSFSASRIGDAVLYDQVIGKIIHIPSQITARKKLNVDTNRLEALQRYGDFLVEPLCPKNTYIRRSNQMVEAVLSVAVDTAQRLYDQWGHEQLKNVIDNKPEASFDKYTVYEYWDYKVHYVWAEKGENLNVNRSLSGGITLMDEKWNMPFLPFAVSTGDGEPLMYASWKSGSWKTANVVGTLVVSKAIALFGRAQERVTGPGANEIYEDMDQIGGKQVIPTGTEVKDVDARTLDPALSQLWTASTTQIQEETVPRMLMTAEAQAGEAFSGYNLRLQTAVGQLLPYQRITEAWYAECFEKMLLWAHYTGTDIEGYQQQREGGRFIKISASKIKPKKINISVKLEPDVPTDRMAKVQAAINMKQQLKFPSRSALEELGDTNPEETIKDWEKEQVRDAIFGGVVEQIRMEASGQIEQMAMEMAQQMAQPTGGPPQGGPPQGGPGGMPPGGMMGVTSNPAVGEVPPAQISPELNTFEGQTGMTRAGDAI
ncbi:MAG: hypothetical protein DRJ03_22855 [Chloroflexi bacterium]|nr:MAG: hypothetical protein DRJ03_22855 [Chloroflexota bacterium]